MSPLCSFLLFTIPFMAQLVNSSPILALLMTTSRNSLKSGCPMTYVGFLSLSKQLEAMDKKLKIQCTSII